jgi:hypothetical protein
VCFAKRARLLKTLSTAGELLRLGKRVTALPLDLQNLDGRCLPLMSDDDACAVHI